MTPTGRVSHGTTIGSVTARRDTTAPTGPAKKSNGRTTMTDEPLQEGDNVRAEYDVFSLDGDKETRIRFGTVVDVIGGQINDDPLVIIDPAGQADTIPVRESNVERWDGEGDPEREVDEP